MRNPLVRLEMMVAAALAIMLMLLQPEAGHAASDEAMEKIIAKYENVFGPIYVMWSDHDQMQLAMALIVQAQKDGKITPGEGQIIERFKMTEFGGAMSPAPDLLQYAQQTWLGVKRCWKEGCLRDKPYAIVKKVDIIKRKK